MDAHVKAGEVYLQPRKPSKKWKHMWMTLYPPSRSAVGRLEIQEMGMSKGGGGPNVVLGSVMWRDGKVKMIRLSEILSVLALPPHAEACPKDNMSAFCVETEERKLVFAVMKDECMGWVERLCDIAFQRGTWCSPGSVSQLQMKENQIYATREKVPSLNLVRDFLVHVQQTEAAACCGLQGACWLHVGQDALMLREAEKDSCSVWEWPYKLLRRYGREKMVLSIEAGRRCDSGPGTFSFATEQANEIFSLMEAIIKQQWVTADSASNQLSVNTGTVNRRPNLPLPKIPDMATVAATFEESLNVQIKKSPSSEASVYAQPIDSLGQTKPLLQAATDVYVDPATILPIKPPSNASATEAPPVLSSASCSNVYGDQPEPVYSEVFDKVHPHRVQKNKAKCFGDAEPIYYEPTKEAGGPPYIIVSKPDPFSHLYAQVHKHPSSSCVFTEKPTSL